LKNQGYHFEHNYGHGGRNLATVLALLMMLAFLIDQIQQLSGGLFGVNPILTRISHPQLDGIVITSRSERLAIGGEGD
jgi:hypothetical protein